MATSTSGDIQSINWGALADELNSEALHEHHPLPWGVLEHERWQISCFPSRGDDLRSAAEALITATQHCSLLSQLPEPEQWSHGHARAAAAAFWFFHDVWPGLREEIVTACGAYPETATDPNLQITLFPNLRVPWENSLELGLFTVDAAAQFFQMSLDFDLSETTSLPPAQRGQMCQDVAAAASKLRRRLGVISDNALNTWRRAIKADVRRIVEPGPPAASESSRSTNQPEVAVDRTPARKQRPAKPKDSRPKW